MPAPAPSPADAARHRSVYATPNLPRFAVHPLDDRLLAGRNPLTAVDVADLARQGVTHVLDLREPHEWRAPGRFGSEAVEACGPYGLERRNLPVPDLGAPIPAVLSDAVSWLSDALKKPGTKVLVHCRAGRERTGSVLAALLVSRGMALEEALAMLRARCGASPLPAQEAAVRAWAAARSTGSRPSDRDRIRGCLLGGAIGDALGAPVEFLSLRDIRRTLGPAGVTGFMEAVSRRGAFTDDTQMTLFTVEGLIRARQRQEERGIWQPAPIVHNAYLRWLDTQDEAGGVSGAEQALAPGVRGWLVDEPVLRRRCAPGSTCLAGLSSGRLGSRTARLNDSKGCGGVMRVAPVGLMAEDPYELGCDLAALTHGHPSGFIAAGAFALAIATVAKGGTLRDAVAAAQSAAAGDPEGSEVAAAVGRAVATADAGVASPEVLETLGGGWVAEEALAITCYAALVEPAPRRALLLAVNHSGDSDSTGSMVGQLLGAARGITALPKEWVDAVEGREIVERVAEDFAVRFAEGRAADGQRYPGT